MIELNENYVPQILCLGVQFLLTAISSIRIIDNRQQFPILQLGPYSTIFCSLCFFFANVIHFVGRIIYKHNNFLTPCAFYQSDVRVIMTVLAILYNIIRQLPFSLFAIKTLRVSLCFWPTFNKINVEDINKWFVEVLKNQSYFICVCIFYVCLINVLSVAFGETSQQSSKMLYEFFCPKIFSVIQIVIYAIRVLILGFVYYLSIWTYDELDFKRFLLLIFLSSNLSIVPRLFIAFVGQDQVNKRDAVYFTSFIIQLINSCIMMYYSGINKKLNQPAMQGVLQSWQAFHNLRLGMDVLYQYASYCDQHAPENKKINVRCLEIFDYFDQLLKQLCINKNLDLKTQLGYIQEILTQTQLIKERLGPTLTNQYIRQCKAGTMTTQNIKKIERLLSNYCEHTIFVGWKKTKSYKYLKQDFINNGDINEKLGLFQISIS